VDRRVIPQLESLHLSPDAHLHFGRDAVLPRQDTLDFSSLQVWERNLAGAVWDPASLSSFWFELVNGAYGDVYRAKALMNLPDGRAFFCNWMVSREGSQFLPLQTLASPDGRPQRLSRLVVQGKDLDPAAIEVTLADCLLSDAVLELQQAPLRQRQSSPSV
jgi:G3E family GTPase